MFEFPVSKTPRVIFIKGAAWYLLGTLANDEVLMRNPKTNEIRAVRLMWRAT